MDKPPEADSRYDAIRRMMRSRGTKHGVIADIRCPKDGRRLAALLQLHDGFWLWHVGIRFSRSLSRYEAEAQFSDAYDGYVSEADRAAIREAGLEILPEGERLDLMDEVMHVIIQSDEPIQSYRLPNWTIGGLPSIATGTCRCHRTYLLELFELIRAAAAKVEGVGARSTVHVRPRAIERFPFHRSDEV
ncbi:hypothetical protein AB0C27_19560 [Nonomuraea sp. NPDC048882]|uniref:hypothetical protein n=1 Tax=Nonomuraea sp. NPDC048882 TaxID=3154347 RepID=UPI0033CBF4C9